MVQLIVGREGKGKTKELLNKVNTAIKSVNGNVVYLDKSTKHMYELNNKIRLIDVSSYPIMSSAEFLGFICGVISQDHDLEEIYLDSFLKITKVCDSDIENVIRRLEAIGKQFQITFTLSISKDREELPEEIRGMIIAEM